MSILGNLGGLGGLGKLIDPGAIVKDVVSGILPKEMGALGGVAGAMVDFNLGNPIGGVQHAMEALKDLPQMKGLQGKSPNGVDLNRNPSLEPSAPRDGKPFDWNDLLSAIKALTAALTGQGTSGTGRNQLLETVHKALPSGPAAQASAPAAPAAAAGEPAVAAKERETSSAPRGSSAPAATGTVRTTTVETSAWVGAPRTPAPATSASSHAPPANAASGSNAAPAASPAPVADPPAAASGPASPNNGQTITSVTQLQGMSDRAVKDAVMNGRIAPEVAKDQVAMMAIQQRMNAISEMNNLMTAMMRALHDMQMAIIQNIRI
jgi:hypothetical protein